MKFWRASVTILTLTATLLGGQSIFRCLMADSVTLSACHCPEPRAAAQAALEQAEDGSCCTGYDLPNQLQATSTSEAWVAHAPTALIAQLPRQQNQPQRHAQRTECDTSRALAPPLYQQFCRILI